MYSQILGNVGLVFLGLVALYFGTLLVMTWLIISGRMHRIERAVRPYQRYYQRVGLWFVVAGTVAGLFLVGSLLLVYLLAHPEALWGLPQ